ncbi:mediator of RNA polymerase II transcription subunit 7-like isoform X1 [Varroa destructor]|uniref:Mediator of RNA polymerase II transcription subunit 7 n=2 Tax=Varroa destructor TaxID=109461 RepID=A0A7M7JZ61_VARDE|nr:mediator of RNA polymerase II transcription subunit 7-like isoform X1 [Varroa destructor]
MMSERSSSLPLPPLQYVKHYTDENIARGRALSPPKPITEAYRMFDAPFHPDDAIIRPLETQGIKRLHPQSYDPKRELKKLNHSILVNFIDMIDVLIKCPDTSRREEKKDDLNLLFVHMHHLINEFRPHQARETLRVMLEVQKKQRLDTAERFQKQLEKVAEMLKATTDSLPTDNQLSVDQLLESTTRMIWSAREAKNAQDGREMPEMPQCDPRDRFMCELVDNNM